MTDAAGPGSHVLYQDFVVSGPVAPLTLIAFDLFIGNRAIDFFTAGDLDFSTPLLNQQARVDILTGGSDPFSVAPGDVLMNLFQTAPGDPLVSGYTSHSADVTALLNARVGETLRLRFAEVDNVFTFQFGVDNVSLQASTSTVPETGTLALLGLGLARLVASRRRKRGAHGDGVS
jgi:hypothetical protein